MARKLVTIITVVFNAQKTLEDTIMSVLSQDNELIEYCIIDGGSTDGTINIIRQYEKYLNWWCSEPDKGIYDAMNKGIANAKGKWILFLGADDKLFPNVISGVKNYLTSDTAAVFGKVQFDTGKIMSSFVSWRTYVQNTVHHQSVFYNSDLFGNFRYDTSFKAISDYELNLIICVEKMKYKKVDLIISECYSSGTSSDFDLSLRETNSVRHKVVTNSVFNAALSFVLYTYYWQKKVRKVSLAG